MKKSEHVCDRITFAEDYANDRLWREKKEGVD